MVFVAYYISRQYIVVFFIKFFNILTKLNELNDL